VLDGLCKLISLDMRVVDANWIGLKLKKLLNFGEQNGEFWAAVPGEERSALYPSTVAYIATLLLHRYKVLGILDDDGRAIQSAGILALPDAVKVIEHETAPIRARCAAAAERQRSSSATAASSARPAGPPGTAVERHGLTNRPAGVHGIATGFFLMGAVAPRWSNSSALEGE